MSDIIFRYKGVTKGTMDASGVGTIHTGGHYSDADYEVEYTKPSEPSAPYNDVNFWDDYTGKIIYSYSASEFQALTDMPPNPTHDGMISQGWNWTLADAKTQLATVGYLSIGQMYVTADGNTRAYITIPNNARRNVRVNWNQTVARGISVDFGDGSAAVTVTGTGNKYAVHEYASKGDYVITLTVLSGVLKLGNGGNSSTLIQSGDSAVRYPYCAMLKRLEIGSGITIMNDQCLYNAFQLQTLTIPNTITAFNKNLFYSCYTLKHVTIPSSCTIIQGDVFRACRSLFDVSIPKQSSFPSGGTFRDNQLINISLPPISTITEYLLGIGGTISRIVIPSTVTSVAVNAFNSMSGMKELHFLSASPPTLANDNAFTGIPSDCIIYVPSASLSAYQSAWPTYASYMVGE